MLTTERWQSLSTTLRWLPAYLWQRVARRRPHGGNTHVLLALADHFEPAFVPGITGPGIDLEHQVRRLDDWCDRYPSFASPWIDTHGRPFRHTYFYPAEQHHEVLIERLAEHCHDGWGDIEIHLHHGVERPDTAANTRRTLESFRDALVRHGCLSRWEGAGGPRYAFVHGNWALANSNSNRCCGVDDEMHILADTGCYADFTLPSAPHPAQVSKINSLYECALPLNTRAPHRRGRDLQVGTLPVAWPLIVQGPLGLRFSQMQGAVKVKIENAELSAANPPTLARFEAWQDIPIIVKGQPDWIFIKLHCHGMDPRDTEAMLGPPLANFLRDLCQRMADDPTFEVHFLTAREMTNVILAACDGRAGDPGQYVDYRLLPITRSRRATGPN